MTPLRKPIALLALALLGFVGTSRLAAQAQEPSDKPLRPTIRVSGEATVTAKPDQAELALGVVTQAATGQAASSQNAQKVDAVLSQLKKLLGQGAEIKTLSYSLSPNYRYPKEGGEPTISGYTASNTIQVKTGDLPQVGKLIDAATQSGANSVQSLRFTLKDEQAALSQALREAALKARAKADALASALKVRIVRVVQVDEGGQPMRPMFYESMAARTAVESKAPTPVEPGTVEVQAMVSLIVEIAQ
jgi:uncharacterized protein YggE